MPFGRHVGSGNKIVTNMAGNEVEDLASLEAKVVNEGAVVELIRRYSQKRNYVSNILAARAVFFFSNSC